MDKTIKVKFGTRGSFARTTSGVLRMASNQRRMLSHECCEFDGLRIDETSPEIEVCSCFPLHMYKHALARLANDRADASFLVTYEDIIINAGQVVCYSAKTAQHAARRMATTATDRGAMIFRKVSRILGRDALLPECDDIPF